MESSNDQEWRDAFKGYFHSEKSHEILKNGTPAEVVNQFIYSVTRIDWRWRDEITKYYPDLVWWSFAGPHATVRWLMDKIRKGIQPRDENDLYVDVMKEKQEQLIPNAVKDQLTEMEELMADQENNLISLRLRLHNLLKKYENS